MEKDYFLDRPEESTIRSKVPPGTEVFICEKYMQKLANHIDDLTRVVIIENLTSQEVHPRGQKVRGQRYIKDKNGNNIPCSVKVGRVVYICRENMILTKNGYKNIE